MINLYKYHFIINKKIKKHLFDGDPKELYNAINYMISNNGKYIRPILCLMVISFFKKKIDKYIKSTLSLEYFHNALLIHDDIMDNAFLRRKIHTINKKWGINRAILSGDTLLIKSYQFLENIPYKFFYKIISEFSNMAIKVCEGQQMDINFDKKNIIKYEQYIKMITYKTASLIGISLKIGAILGEATEKDILLFYNLGEQIGIAFQMKNDLENMYKNINGIIKYKKYSTDIKQNKKTILYFKAIQIANQEQKKEILYWYNNKIYNLNKLKFIKKIFKDLNIAKEVKKEIYKYYNKSISIINKISINNVNKKILIKFIKNIIKN